MIVSQQTLERFARASLLLSLALILLSASNAIAEPATFETLYNPAKPTNWVMWGLGAVAMGALVFFTAGLASPFVAVGVSSIGSAIGGMMGFSGAAATSAGLAFLGGGSIAAGGFGMAGGAALLTTALTFGTEVIVDQSINYLTLTPVDLSTASRGRIDLRFPVYKKGARDLRKISEHLEEHIRQDELLDSAHNRLVLTQARDMCYKANADEVQERLQITSTAALLSFILDDYQEAFRFATLAQQEARLKGESAPVADYLYGVSSLSIEHSGVDHFASVGFALMTEARLSKDSFFQGVTPLLISVYADRLQIQVTQGALSPLQFNKVIDLINALNLSEHSKFNSTYPLATRQLIMLKLLQNKIQNITQSENPTIKTSTKALALVLQSLQDYKILLNGLNRSAQLLTRSAHKDNQAQATQVQLALLGYQSDLERLSGLINTFEDRMKSSEAALRSAPQAQPPKQQGGSLWSKIKGWW